MRLAWVIALVVACGSSAPPHDVAHHAPDDRRVVERFEIHGVSEARAGELRALVREQIAPGVELTEARYDAAHRAIENDYYDRGHIGVRITWPDFDKTTGPFTLVLTIREGPRFKIKSLDVADPDRARLLALATQQPGDVFSRTKLRAWTTAIATAAPGANIEPETTIDLVAETVAITMHLRR